MRERELFLPTEVVIALVVALLAQASFVAIFLLPPPAALEANISDENTKPIAVAITPVPILKLGSKDPAKLPSAWQRSKPVPTQVAANTPPPPDKDRHAQPSTFVDAGASPAASLAAGASPSTTAVASSLPPADSAIASAATSASSAPAASVSGAATGAADGTETDPLKARAADMYRAQLAAWFASRFAIRGKIPFDTLKTLSASASVSTSPDRHVTGFSIGRPSGNEVFDAEVRATLQGIQSSGVELPAPPPLYPDMLGRTLPVSFRCTNRSQCE